MWQAPGPGFLAQVFVAFKLRFHLDQSMVEIPHHAGEFADVVDEGRDSFLQRHDLPLRHPTKYNASPKLARCPFRKGTLVGPTADVEQNMMVLPS